MKGRDIEDKFNIFDVREKEESELSFDLDKKKKMQDSSINLGESDDSSRYAPNRTQ